MATTKATELSQLSSALQVDESTGEIIFTGSLSVDSNTLFVDGDSNRVGIGTLTPGSALDVSGDVTVTGTVDGRDIASDGSKLDGVESNADVTDTANVTSAGALMDSELTNESAVKNIDQELTTSSDVDFGGLDVDSGTLFVDSANGRVGIGTSSPSKNLDVNGLIRSENQFQGNTSSGNSSPAFSFDGDADTGMFRATPNTLGFATNGSEAARIDSDGNLLVGTTSGLSVTDSNNTGLSFNSFGRIVAARSAAPPLFLNRLDSDGDIVQFRKDGSTVGSIGVDSDGLIQDGNRTDYPSFTKAGRKHFFISDIRQFDEETSSSNDQGVVILCPKFLDDVFPVSGGATARSDAPKMRLIINASSDYQTFQLDPTFAVYFGIDVTVIPGLRNAGDTSETVNPEVVISKYATTGDPRGFKGGLVEVDRGGTPWIGIEEGVQGGQLGGGQEGFHIIRYNMNMGIDINSNPDSILSDIRNDFVRHIDNLVETDIRNVGDINITDNTGLYNP